MKKIMNPWTILSASISGFFFMFVDGDAFLVNFKSFINQIVMLDTKYIPFIISIIFVTLIFTILMSIRKYIKKTENEEWLINFFLAREELFYEQMNDLINRLNTFVTQNNKEHEEIISAINEGLKGTVENLKNGVYTQKELKSNVGKNDSAKFAFDHTKELLKKERNKLHEMANNRIKKEKDEHNRDNKQVPD